MSNYGFTPKEFDKPCYVDEYYEPIEYIQDHRFGDVILLQNKTNVSDLLMLKEKFSTNLHDCERDIFQVRERLQLNHPCLLNMVDYSTKMIQEPNSEAEFLVCGYYEYPESDLEREVERRKEGGEYFTEIDLLKMIENVLDCLAFLQQGKMVHGDVRPKYIDFKQADDERPCKLLDRMGDPNPPNQVQLKNMRMNYSLYMSPSLYKNLAQKESKVRHNPYKSDVFSLGVIVLESGLLHSVQDIYDKELKDINIEILLGHLDEFCTIYENELIKEVVCLLMDLDEKTRKDPRRMLDHFRQLLGMPEEIEEEEIVEAGEGDIPHHGEGHNNEEIMVETHNIQRGRDGHIQHQGEEHNNDKIIVETHNIQRGHDGHIQHETLETVTEIVNRRSLTDNKGVVEVEKISEKVEYDENKDYIVVEKHTDIVVSSDRFTNKVVESKNINVGASPNLPVEEVMVDVEFHKRDDESKKDKSDLQFDFEGPPHHKEDNDDRNLSFQPDIAHQQLGSTIDKKKIDFNFVNTTVLKVGNDRPMEHIPEQPRNVKVDHYNTQEQSRDISKHVEHIPEQPRNEKEVQDNTHRFAEDVPEQPRNVKENQQNINRQFEHPYEQPRDILRHVENIPDQPINVKDAQDNTRKIPQHIPEQPRQIKIEQNIKSEPVQHIPNPTRNIREERYSNREEQNQRQLQKDIQHQEVPIPQHTQYPETRRLEDTSHNVVYPFQVDTNKDRKDNQPYLSREKNQLEVDHRHPTNTISSHPVEKVEISATFGKREDLAQMDKRNLEFDFEGPPHPKPQILSPMNRDQHNVGHVNANSELDRRAEPIQIDISNQPYDSERPSQVRVTNNISMGEEDKLAHIPQHTHHEDMDYQSDNKGTPHTNIQHDMRSSPQNALQTNIRDVPYTNVQHDIRSTPQNTLPTNIRDVSYSHSQTGYKDIPYTNIQTNDRDIPYTNAQNDIRSTPQNTLPTNIRDVPYSNSQTDYKDIPYTNMPINDKDIPNTNIPTDTRNIPHSNMQPNNKDISNTNVQHVDASIIIRKDEPSRYESPYDRSQHGQILNQLPESYTQSSRTVVTYGEPVNFRYSSRGYSQPSTVTYIRRDPITGQETRVSNTQSSTNNNNTTTTSRVYHEDPRMQTSNHHNMTGTTTQHVDDERRFVSDQLLSTIEEKKQPTVSVQPQHQPHYLSKISEAESTNERSQYSNPEPTIIRYQYGQPAPNYNNYVNDTRSGEDSSTKRELYMAPGNFKEMKRSLRSNTPDIAIDNKLSKANNEVNAYNYEYFVEPGSNVRRYVLKRNPAKPFLQSNIQHSTQANTFTPQPVQQQTYGFTGPSVGSLVIDDNELNKRYDGLEMREENPNYSVYRVGNPVSNITTSERTGQNGQRISMNRVSTTYTIRRDGREYTESYNIPR